jgi:hypothetical protein
MYKYTCEICGKPVTGHKRTGKYCQPKIGQYKSKCQMIAIRSLEKERKQLKLNPEKNKHKHSRHAGDWADQPGLRQEMIRIKQVEIERLQAEHDMGETELDVNCI